jgi:hypothetical protein
MEKTFKDGKQDQVVFWGKTSLVRRSRAKRFVCEKKMSTNTWTCPKHVNMGAYVIHCCLEAVQDDSDILLTAQLHLHACWGAWKRWRFSKFERLNCWNKSLCIIIYITFVRTNERSKQVITDRPIRNRPIRTSNQLLLNENITIDRSSDSLLLLLRYFEIVWPNSHFPIRAAIGIPIFCLYHPYMFPICIIV